MDHLAPNSAVPALLVFTLGESHESRRRRLLPASWSALEQRLHRACLETALDAGRAAGCRLQVSSPVDCGLPTDVAHRPQQGRSFGTRLRHALGEAFAATQGPVALVGSDVPGLSAGHLRRSFELLEKNPEQVVIGPSPDGGFYLLASAKPLDEALAEVRWCCRDTLHSLRRALERRGRPVVLLPVLGDLDHRIDLEQWLAAHHRDKGPWHRLVTMLSTLLLLLCRPLEDLPTARPLAPSFARPQERGPPLPATT